MKKHLRSRILALILAVVMVVGQFPAVSAAPAGLRFRETDLEVTLDRSDRLVENTASEETTHKAADMVRVSIVLEKESTLKAGFSTVDIAKNEEALDYNAALQREQETMAKTISRVALNGEKLDVVWNMTLVGNIISANVPYGTIDAIAAIDGVAEVVLEQQYDTTVAESVEPNMYTSPEMIGSALVWQSGYTGAGSRVAIVDTGTDTNHQSFDNGAFLYALEQNAKAEGVSYEEYVASLDLLDAEEIAAVLPNLNATERVGATAAEYYISEKLPFGANYVDYNLDVTHDHDAQGSHGSHVAGIAAANRYIPAGNGYADARETVLMNGVAPDAQIITLKVFGNAAGPYDSDYFAAIEDAIWLGADSVNLSLGSGAPGTSYNDTFADLLEYLEQTDTVVVMSAGNSGYWAESSASPYLYNDGVSFHTGGSPGSYTNSLGVASVDNDGTVGNYIDVAGNMIVYADTSSSGYRNAPMTSLDTSADGSGTVYEYIFVDGIGVESDYAGIDLTGKVVFCHRGETSFYEKGNIAASLGAAAVVVCNNQPGVINMDLTDYMYTAPCVSILQTDGAIVKAASTQQTTADGLTYYTGTVTVSGKMGAAQYNSNYYTMSTFSSWGVPGNLSLKPEITAPGGMIWSINGVDTSGTAYEMMSGTSMAAPQVTGMVALVAEYIRENGLDTQTGMSARHLAQSLLMSTAEPLFEGASNGQYYSLLNQGAGLGRVDLATTAESYILVDGMDDAKVKVELGEDPDRVGIYDFSFSINNLNGQAMTYALSADLFTQDVFDGGNGILYLDTWTVQLPADVAFSVNGVSLEGTVDGFACDLNGDGITSDADADYLLEYLLGNESELHANGDVNADGNVNTYDAHVLLTKLSGEFSVDVPANGTVTVDVTLKLTADVKAYLDAYYPTGAYVESFVYAEPVNDSEGVQGVTHSIPVLGYYGSWTEPSMYDVGSWVEYNYGVENRVPYLYNNNSIAGNFVTINYGDGLEYYFGANPFVEEDEYLPERTAFNNKSGAVLQSLYFALIRNASDSMIVVEDAETGDVYLAQELGELDGAYYHVNQGAWQNTRQKLGMGLNFAGVPEGTRLNLSLIAAPELYRVYNETNGSYTVDWDALADGAYLTTSLTIDNTAPALISAEVGENNTLNLTVKDNEYVAAVALMNEAGTGVLASAAANQTEADSNVTVALDTSAVFGSKFLVAVYDYAENAAYYEITLELDNERPYFTASDAFSDVGGYVGMNADGTALALTPNKPYVTTAGEYVEGYIFEVSEENDLYVTSDSDLYSTIHLSNLDPIGEWQMMGLNDMAYNKADGKLYGNFYSLLNWMAAPYLCTIDLFTGEMEVLGEMPIDANNMAIDGEGNFYSSLYGYSELYTYTADVVETGEYTLVGQLGSYATDESNSMAWDHNTDELYWACVNMGETYLLKIDPATAEVELINSYPFTATGLYIAYEPDSDLFAPTNEVLGVTVDAELTVLANTVAQLTAKVQPWNVADDSVTWTTSDASVAAVDEYGLVYGISAGTAVITATSNLDSTKSASCSVTVTSLDKDLRGLVWDEEGTVWFSEFNTDTLPEYTKLAEAANNLPVNATMVVGDTLYASTLDTSAGVSELYTVDPSTFAMTKVGDSSAAYLDLAYAPNVGYGVAPYFNYVLLVDLATGEYLGAFDWTEGGADLVGITYYGSELNTYYGVYMDYFLILDADGNVYLDAFINLGGGQMGYFNGPTDGFITNIGDSVAPSYFQGFYFDGAYTYWTRFNQADDVVELIVWDCEDSGNVYNIGTFPNSVWPVGGLYSQAEFAANGALADELLASASIREAELMTAITPVALESTKNGSLNAINTTPAVKPMSKAEVAPLGDVTLDVTLPAEASNGTMTITYDASVLEVVNVKGYTEAFAWTAADGKLELAFAEGKAMPADAAVATVAFAAVGEGDTTVTIATGEWNADKLDSQETVELTLPHICPSERFVDVGPGLWYHEAVDYVVAKGYMNGMDGTHFGPDLTMTRAQFVTVLYRMEGEPETTNTGVFKDVPQDYYTDAAYWALETGITTGMDAEHFAPGNPLTRAQLVTFMYRYAKYKGYDTSATASLDAYTDAYQVSEFARVPFAWALTHDIVTGVTADTLVPEGTATRAQAATIFMRLDKTFGNN